MAGTAASGEELTGFQRAMITVSTMLATIMQALDTTIANVALPHIQGSLSASQEQIAWVLTSYIVAAAIMTPLTGWLADRYGRKRVFLMSVVGFTIASALCGLAFTLPEIVLYRLLQGICGAALVPLSQALLLDINPPAKHGQAMAIWGVGIMIGPILGPALGGWLTDNYSWRWVFFINLPVGVLALLGIMTFVTESKTAKPQSFDFFGFTTLSLAVGATQMLLDRGEIKDWFGSTEIVIEAVVAVTALYLFIVHTATARRSFLSRALLKDRNFVASTVFMFFVGVVLYGTLTLQPQMLQGILGYPVITTGIVTAPRGIGTMVAMMIVGRVIQRVDSRLIILFGLVLTAVSLWQMTGFSLEMGMGPIITTGLLQGFGLGFVFVPLSTITFATLAPQYRTEGSSIFSLMRNVGSSIGISIVEAMLTEKTQILHAHMIEQVRPDNPLMRDPAFAHSFDLTTRAGIAAINAMVTRQASMLAYLNDFWLMMLVTVGTLPLLLLLRRPKNAVRATAME
jgi:MFS transporter, DHA2 family, multidrug resistance protein